MKGNNKESMNEKSFYTMNWINVCTELSSMQSSKGYDDIDSYYRLILELKRIDPSLIVPEIEFNQNTH